MEIKCNYIGNVEINQLNEFQGNLKELSKENYEKLRSEIEKTGFAFAIHAWKNPEDQKHYVIDGHQRLRVLKKMQSEGVVIPAIPIVEVQASSYEEAKHRILQGTSQYGKITDDGLHEFISHNSIDPGDLSLRFSLPDINIGKFRTNFYDREEEPEADKELCPTCGRVLR